MQLSRQNFTEAIAHRAAEAERVVAQAMAVAITDNSGRTQNAEPIKGGPIMKLPTFNWEAKDKYSKLKNLI